MADPIAEPGLYKLTEDEYHSDPCPKPSLSASLATAIITRSPRHAWTESRRLNPDWRERRTGFVYDAGRALHAFLLEGHDGCEVLPAEFQDYRAKAARERRDEAREGGRYPMLAHQYDELLVGVERIKEQLAQVRDPQPLSEGQPEATIVWQEPGDVWCRARLDWLRDDLTWVDDLKTTSMSVNPNRLASYLFRERWIIQGAFYRRAVRRVLDADPRFRWVFAEQSGAFAVSVVTLDAAGWQVADGMVDDAIDAWARCLETGEWPAYPTKTLELETPAYELNAWEEEALG